MGSKSTRGTGVLPFFCADDCGVGSVLAVRVGERVGKVRSAGFIVWQLPDEVHLSGLLVMAFAMRQESKLKTVRW